MIPNNELYHYGVKRRSGRYPWGSGKKPYQGDPIVKKGVRKKKELAKNIGVDLKNYQTNQNRPMGEAVNLKKGDKVQHIGVNFSGKRKGQMYVTALETDNKLYEAFLSLNLLSKGYEPKKVTLTLSEDLKSPERKEQKKIFDSFYSQNKEQVDKDLKKWASEKNKKLADVYDDFMNSLEKSSNSQKMFYDELRKRGYNAVLDEHDIEGSWIQGSSPLIIMDQLTTIGDFEIKNLNTTRLKKALNDWLELYQ